MVGYRESFYMKLTLFSLFLCLKCFVFGDNNKIKGVPEDVISDLYLKYKEAISDDKTNISSRRLFKNDKQYEIHVKRLKEVNGFKVHNLMIKENLRTDSDPLIYINNPVESKIPKAFLSLEEFKNVLTNRVMVQRNELTTKNKRKLFKRKPNEPAIKEKTNNTKLNNKTKPNKVIDTSNKKLATELELVLDSIAPKPSSVKLDISTTELIMTKVHTESSINLIAKQEEETISNINNQLVKTYSDSIKFSDKVLTTTLKLNVANKTTDKNEDETVFEIEKQSISTTLGNFTEKVIETTVMDNIISVIKNNQELNKEVKNDENEVTIITDVKTLQEELNTVQTTRMKERPRRKTTTKLSHVSKASKGPFKQEKRSTLGRPLVFMGNR